MNSNHTSSPETMLGEVQSIEHLPRVYDDALSLVVGDYSLAMSGLSCWVDGYRESGLTLSKFLSEHQQKIQDVTSDSSKAIGRIIGLIPDILDDLPDFSDIDKTTLTKAQRDASGLHGGIRFALTHDIPNASSKQARVAIHSALDDIILTKAQRDASGLHEGIRFALKHDIPNASSKQARTAMHSALDEIILTKAQRDASGLHDGIRFALKHDIPNASSQQARQIIENEVVSNTTSSRRSHNHQNQSESSRSSNTHSGSQQGRKGSSKSGQNSHKESGQNGRQSQSNPNGKSTNQESRESSEYEKLMTKLKKESFDLHKTLSGFEEADVTKVIMTVLKIREKDPETTDRNIALRYLRRTNNAQNPEPAHLTASQIVMVLLNGSIKNKFPF